MSTKGSGTAVLVTSYGLLLVFLFLNRRIPASSAMTIGLLLNLAVVGLNGGMPVSAEAIRVAAGSSTAAGGVPSQASSPKHHLMSDDDVLRPLADVIPVPPPFGVVISIGDVFLYGGMAWFASQVTRGRSRVNPRPLAMWFPTYRGKHAPDHWRLSSRNREGAHAAEGPLGTGQR